MADDSTDFWDSVEYMLQTSPQSLAQPEFALRQHLSDFFSLCDNNYDHSLDSQSNHDYLISRLIDSSLLSSFAHPDICEALVSLATSATSLPTLYLIYESLLKYAARNADFFRNSSSAHLLIPRLVHHFWAARYAEEYMQKHSVSALKQYKEVEEHVTSGVRNDWNIVHIRSSSSGHPKKQMEESRNRTLQCKLRDRSVQLLYVICRAQRLVDLRAIDATFVNHLFELVEQSRNWIDDAYNYQVIKLIVALNEQFMVAGLIDPRKSSHPSGNIVMTVLRTRLNASKTFGENLIFMLNRASNLDAEDICMQLLVLKLLYLLFTTPETSHYFYTNDLKVLVDVFVRELSDLPDDHEALRHTYLRVLHPLLTNTQLLTYPYKRQQIRQLLIGLTSHGQIRDISATTQRLVDRCLSAQWCVDLDKGKNMGHDLGNGHLHNYAVQNVGGGPHMTIQAQTITDPEGVSIPLQGNQKPYQSVASTTDIADAVAVAVERRKSEDHADKVTTTERPPMLRRTSSASKGREMRTRSISSVSPKLSHNLDLSDSRAPHSQSAFAVEDEPSAHTLRRNLSYRSASAAASSSPLRTHSAIDVRSINTNDHGEDTDDESFKGDGSASNSWHQSMAGDHLFSNQWINSCGQRESSPLSVDSTNQWTNYQSLDIDAPSPHPFQSDNEHGIIPSVHVEDLSCETLKPTSTKRRTERRRPPDPPCHEKSRKERIGESCSAESNLRAPHEAYTGSARLTASDDHPRLTKSAPRSPLNSQVSSRAGTPTAKTSQTALSSVSHRRKPPPPPVDRSTKITRSRTPDGDFASPQHNTTPSVSEKDSPATTNVERHQSSLSQYLDQLHLTNESPYGW